MNFAIATSPGNGSTTYSSFSNGPPSINSWIRYTYTAYHTRKEREQGDLDLDLDKVQLEKYTSKEHESHYKVGGGVARGSPFVAAS